MEIDGDESPWEDDSLHQSGMLSLVMVTNNPAMLPGNSSPSSGK